jgi:hypothetical protein
MSTCIEKIVVLTLFCCYVALIIFFMHMKWMHLKFMGVHQLRLFRGGVAGTALQQDIFRWAAHVSIMLENLVQGLWVILIRSDSETPDTLHETHAPMIGGNQCPSSLLTFSDGIMSHKHVLTDEQPTL